MTPEEKKEITALIDQRIEELTRFMKKAATQAPEINEAAVANLEKMVAAYAGLNSAFRAAIKANKNAIEQTHVSYISKKEFNEVYQTLRTEFPGLGKLSLKNKLRLRLGCAWDRFLGFFKKR